MRASWQTPGARRWQVRSSRGCGAVPSWTPQVADGGVNCPRNDHSPATLLRPVNEMPATILVRLPSCGYRGTVELLLIADTHLPKRAKDLPRAVWDQVDGVDVVLHAGD